jgi:hypothetical protein
MKSAQLQFLLKLVSHNVVEIETFDDTRLNGCTRLNVCSDQWVLYYYPSDGSHDFMVESIVFLSEGGHVNIIAVDMNYTKVGLKIEEFDLTYFALYQRFKF